jgi:Putative prokaryotic signal transducing protein
VDEVIVATVDSEPIAELIAGRLRSEGIPARVRFESQTGIPRQMAPVGLGFGPGAFRVAVFAHDAGRARDILAEAEPLRRGRSLAFRAVALALLIAFVLVWVPGIIGEIGALFDLAR